MESSKKLFLNESPNLIISLPLVKLDPFQSTYKEVELPLFMKENLKYQKISIKKKRNKEK